MNTPTSATIAILGLSDNSSRYSFLAYQRLLTHGYKKIYGVSNKDLDLPSITCLKEIDQLPRPIHTLTMYVGAAHSTPIIDKIIKLAPKRIIFNPGSENDQLEQIANQAGIEVIHGCTLVMLSTDQF